MGKKGPLWWRESDWLLRGSSAANQILLRHSGPILSPVLTLHSGDGETLWVTEQHKNDSNELNKQLLQIHYIVIFFSSMPVYWSLQLFI